MPKSKFGTSNILAKLKGMKEGKQEEETIPEFLQEGNDSKVALRKSILLLEALSSDIPKDVQKKYQSALSAEGSKKERKQARREAIDALRAQFIEMIPKVTTPTKDQSIMAYDVLMKNLLTKIDKSDQVKELTSTVKPIPLTEKEKLAIMDWMPGHNKKRDSMELLKNLQNQIDAQQAILKELKTEFITTNLLNPVFAQLNPNSLPKKMVDEIKQNLPENPEQLNLLFQEKYNVPNEVKSTGQVGAAEEYETDYKETSLAEEYPKQTQSFAKAFTTALGHAGKDFQVKLGSFLGLSDLLTKESLTIFALQQNTQASLEELKSQIYATTNKLDSLAEKIDALKQSIVESQATPTTMRP